MRITWYVMSSGGGHASSTNYTLDSTMGQPLAWLTALTTGWVVASGTFWACLR